MEDNLWYKGFYACMVFLVLAQVLGVLCWHILHAVGAA